ncbi:MAG: Gfo/Idh/MocA family oxidoreductase [Lachnospiraceae bacterium]
MKKINVGLIGAGFMAKAHSVAYAGMPMFFWPAPAIPYKKMIVDIQEELAKDACEKFAFESYSTDWHDVINNSEIDVVDICTPNNVHAEIAIAAAKAGKHILCEKPLSLTTTQAKEMYLAAKENNITTLVAFNYRKTPAVQLAKKYIEEGAIGDILDFRGTYLQDWSADPDSPLSWRFQKKICGSGALGDIGTHVVDMLRYLVGDFDSVMARTATYIKERPIQSSLLDSLGNTKGDINTKRDTVDVDDQCCFMVNCKNGAFGTVEATRNAWGRNNYITFEIHGTKGSIAFNYERRDELQVCFANDGSDRRGFRTVYTGPNHPYGDGLWPIPALGIGYTETKIIECYDFFKAIAEGTQASPNFKDGYAIELISEAVLESAKENTWVKVNDLEEN